VVSTNGRIEERRFQGFVEVQQQQQQEVVVEEKVSSRQ
jgi:hypothetical protein